jgi:membrane protein required for colicin V production
MNLPFTFLDAVIVLVIVASAGYAAWRGFIWETLTIFAWIAAAFGCLWLGPSVIPITRDMVHQDWLARLLAYAAAFLAIFIPFAFISHRFSESVKHSPIGPLDRVAGVVFGVLRGLVIVGAAYLAFTFYTPICAQPDWLTQTRLLPVVQTTAETIVDAIPQKVENGITDTDHCGRGTIDARAPDGIRQTPRSHDPMADLIRQGSPPAAHSNGVADLFHRAIAPKSQAGKPAKPDSMADLIKHDGDASSVSKDTREPVLQQNSKSVTKSSGAKDRQRLNDLIETGGNDNR